jgi:hypothetical protein
MTYWIDLNKMQKRLHELFKSHSSELSTCHDVTQYAQSVCIAWCKIKRLTNTGTSIKKSDRNTAQVAPIPIVHTLFFCWNHLVIFCKTNTNGKKRQQIIHLNWVILKLFHMAIVLGGLNSCHTCNFDLWNGYQVLPKASDVRLPSWGLHSKFSSDFYNLLSNFRHATCRNILRTIGAWEGF